VRFAEGLLQEPLYTVLGVIGETGELWRTSNWDRLVIDLDLFCWLWEFGGILGDFFRFGEPCGWGGESVGKDEALPLRDLNLD